MRKTKPPEQRFHAKYVRAGEQECWLWKRHKNPDKYPTFYAGDGRRLGANRYALELKTGRVLASDELACHTCDNKRCVNPTHLFVGTGLDNSQDMVTKGRKERGERVYGAKLTDIKVLRLREEYAEGKTSGYLAKKYDITEDNVGFIVRGQTWKHVGGPLGTRSREVSLRAMCGEKSASAKWSEEQVRTFKILVKKGYSVSQAAAKAGISRTAANHIHNGRTWRHIVV